MKFFIPAAKDAADAEKVYESIRKFAKDTLGWQGTPRRIFSIKWHHGGKDYYAEVGKYAPRIEEPVIAILEGPTYLICTPNRGVIRNMPMLVGQNEVQAIVDFEPENSPAA